MPATYLSKLTLPVNVSGTITDVEFTIKDAEARELIEDLGHALYWVGLTESVLTDGATTNPIVIATYAEAVPEAGDNPSALGWYEEDETSTTGYKLSTDTEVDSGKTYYIRTATNKTVNLGGVAVYDGNEYVWNGTAWQEFGQANFGALAFKSSASGSYTPAGSVSLSETTAAETDSIQPVSDVGEVPYFTVNGENATFNAGSVPTLGTAKTFIKTEQVLSATFSGTEATITVE